MQIHDIQLSFELFKCYLDVEHLAAILWTDGLLGWDGTRKRLALCEGWLDGWHGATSVGPCFLLSWSGDEDI